MSKGAIEGLQAEVIRAKELFATLTPEEWAAPSGCTGWRVQDVAQHMAAVYQQIAAADTIEVDVSAAEGAEATAEVVVQARKEWTVDQVVAAYDEWSEKGVAALAALQEPPMADTVVPLGDLGSHPMHLLGDAIAFDHYCHLRHDIGAAVDRAARLPKDPTVLGPAVDWMLAGLPQMCADALASAPQQPINLVFDGPAAHSFCLTPGDPAAGPQWIIANGADDDAPVIRTTAHDFISWATKRADWRDTSTGDVSQPTVAAVLDVVNVI
ncbi:maleylpyruvate isomerase family mycothiol-dependent enzyme [Ilumatobacter coccineus]|uniref:Mycothiol-dependent maleylpyruvate isomerase metal-binding domain-containing protein n=1 Tax=Ilumatobacter coccineus (strain NBRC 103263 / KCTC 29153 / YM16-304) TaxID=1313172 RepID=A0A6C7E6U6_ILUCY|nr:maleylpyruvate isomerase family mycothiol-dependent enzyme [Ilumatobacter coccineus]BAN00338.1 hypothetical protein YM304_00240 [Ilumatobacter coccineus YM16-304]